MRLIITLSTEVETNAEAKVLTDSVIANLPDAHEVTITARTSERVSIVIV